MSQTPDAMQKCIADCTQCHQICTSTLLYCLQQGGKHAEAGHIRALLDCAESCERSVHFMLRKSSFHSKTCALCAEICTTCAENCEAVGDDQQMAECARSCRICAESCLQMSRAA